ncbi:MAG TPA: phage major capsid protein [Steroidobacteraceae bacterium]
MKSIGDIEHRLAEISQECKRFNHNELSDKQIKYINQLADEDKYLQEELDIINRTHAAALGLAGSASPEDYGRANMNPDNSGGFSLPGIPGMENRIEPTSMYSLDKTQIKALQQAAQQRTPLKVTLGSKGIEHGEWGGQIRTKSAVTEGGLTPNLLPPLQQYGPNGWFSLPYELNRVANFLPNVAMEGPGIAYFRHDSNGAEAAYVAEAGTKPDLTPVVTEQYIRPAKVAGQINLTHELVQDAGDAFASHLVTDLARSLYNAESNLLLNGTTGANGFAGVNQVSGTLTQAIGSDTALDCISKAMVALRNDFFEPDLIFMHPSTLGALRRTKDLENRYLLQLMEGPRGINQTAETETLWGVQVVQTTQQAAGTAAVLSVKSGAAVVYVREALTSFYDPYSQSANNIYRYIAETRLALAIPRPTAINLVSGLPTS